MIGDEWESSSLASLIDDAIGGLWGHPHDSVNPDETDVLVIRGADFRRWSERQALDAAPRRIPSRSLNRRQLRPGDLVLEVSGGSPAQPVGRVLVIDRRAVEEVDVPLICSNFCRKIRLRPGVNPAFVKRQLDWKYGLGHMESFQTSTTNIRNLQVDAFLNGTEILLPNAEVQSALVALLDRAQLLRTGAREHLDAAGRSVSRLRQALLSAACAGRLTADWREQNTSTETAGEFVTKLADSRLAHLGRKYPSTAPPERSSDLPDGWAWTTVGALVNVATGATPLRTNASYYNGRIPWVTSGAVNAGRITKAKEFITELAVSETNAKVFPSGTLLVAMYGEGQTRGRVAELGIAAATNQAVAALLFDEETDQLRDYLRLFFLQNYERIRLLSFGGVQPNLSLGVVRATEIPLPPIGEQAEIVRRVKEVLAIADRLRDRVDQAVGRVERSSHAVLAKAFRGELTALGVGQR